jgi:hypothetical protein
MRWIGTYNLVIRSQNASKTRLRSELADLSQKGTRVSLWNTSRRVVNRLISGELRSNWAIDPLAACGSDVREERDGQRSAHDGDGGCEEPGRLEEGATAAGVP